MANSAHTVPRTGRIVPLGTLTSWYGAGSSASDRLMHEWHSKGQCGRECADKYRGNAENRGERPVDTLHATSLGNRAISLFRPGTKAPFRVKGKLGALLNAAEFVSPQNKSLFKPNDRDMVTPSYWLGASGPRPPVTPSGWSYGRGAEGYGIGALRPQDLTPNPLDT